MCLRAGSNKKPCRRDMAVTFSSSISNWASLPKDLHYLILDKLLDPFDHLRFPVVCKEWYAAAKNYNLTTHRWLNKALPMLFIPPSHSVYPNSDKDPLLYSAFENIIHKNVFFPSNLFSVDRMKMCACCSGSQGWFATTDFEREKIKLVNIFRKAMAPICLPRFVYSKHCSFGEHGISSITLSADPLLNPDSYMVIVVFNLGRMLALTKGGQTFWTRIVPKYEIQGEAIFHKDRVYVARKDEGSIMSLDVNSEPLELQQVTPKLDYADKDYLVKSAKGDFLWHVRRRRVWNNKIKSRDYLFSLCTLNPGEQYYTESFRVYKVIIDNKDNSIVEQVEVKSTGDEALFVGDNESFSILASSFPLCHQNSIYYTIDSERSGKTRSDVFKKYDVCIFNLEDCTITAQRSIYKAPIFWIIPPFSGLY